LKQVEGGKCVVKKTIKCQKEGEKNVKNKKDLEKPCRKQYLIITRVLHKIMHANPMYDKINNGNTTFIKSFIIHIQ
jgi:hypothetical protein